MLTKTILKSMVFVDLNAENERLPMNSANQPIELPVHKSTTGGVSLIRIESPREMDDWGEVVNGPLSPKALSVIEEFFGVKPEITSWCLIEGSEIPNTYEFSVPGMTKDAELMFRIWQRGVGNENHAEIDLCAKGAKSPMSGLYCSHQKITWVGIGYNQLLVATEHGVLYRATRRRSSKQDWRGLFWRFSKVLGFWIEMSSLRDRYNQFNSYVPAHLR